MPDPELSPIAAALGRVPTGLYIVSARGVESPVGFVGSFVMQVGFEPPTMCVAVGKGRPHLAALRAAGRFGLSILDPASSRLMGPFFKQYPEGGGPFDAVAWTPAPGGSPVLDEALAWMECEISGEHDVGDHVVLFGTVSHGKQVRGGDPAVHLRKNGLGY